MKDYVLHYRVHMVAIAATLFRAIAGVTSFRLYALLV
jgi:hypothetical protein